jgi:hypothetical protein
MNPGKLGNSGNCDDETCGRDRNAKDKTSRHMGMDES